MKQLFNPITATVWKGGHGAASSICPTKQAVHCIPIIPYRLQCILGILISLIFLFTTAPLSAGSIPAPENVRIIKRHPGFFAYIGGDITWTLNLIADNPDFIGIKKLYNWKLLEPSEGIYDFSEIISDLAKVQAEGKRLWIQPAYVQYHAGGSPLLPAYMCKDTKYGGKLPYCGNYVRFDNRGWLPIIWNLEVQTRFKALFTALGKRFNNEPYIEGITIDETSTGVPQLPGETAGFSPSAELAGFKVRALAAKNAFPDKSVIQQINYTIGWDIEEYGAWCVSHDIGIGIPDFTIHMPNDSAPRLVYPMMKNSRNVVPGGPDVQWNDYTYGPTSAELLNASIDLVDPWYFFWEKREPYFSRDVIPAIRKFHKNGGNLGHK